MRIMKFSAKKVHDFYNFNFNFKEDISFLVGINGSGKTTALRLMQASLSIDLSTLLSINFEKLSIEVESERKRYRLDISQTKERMIFNLNDTRFHFENVTRFVGAGKDISNASMQEYIENHRLELIQSGGSTLQHFISGARPLFLGLERRMGRYDDEVPLTSHWVSETWRKDGHARTFKRPQRETLEGLENCQRLVEKAYMQYRKASDGRVDRLSNIVIESTFEYIEFDPKMLEDPTKNPYVELRVLHQRKEEIEKFVRQLSGSEKVVAQIESFFTKMSQVVDEAKTQKELWSFEWFLNMAQIQRIRTILTEMDRQKKFAERFYAPIKEFCDTINTFLRQSGKELTVDSVGKIKIVQGGKYIDLLTLSSGEKQLLILLAHARFGSTKSSTFIVDEPELSLHMHWQEMLVNALLEGNKGNQFIFATHSPEIVGYRTDNCIQVS